MVSKHWLVALSITTAQILLAAPQQTPPNPNSFRADATPGASAPAEKPTTLITPEMHGDIFMARKMFREAVEAYSEGPKDNAVLLNKTGIAYHQMMELNLARKYYEKSIRADAHYAEAINNLGTVYYAQKSYRRAVSQYLKALRITPNSASIYSNLGTGYFARKDYVRASEAWQHALALDPDVFETRSTRGVLLQERSVEERAKFHYYMAKMYAKQGANDRALLYIRKALEEGFKERDKFQKDPEFAGLKELPEFKELLTLEPRVL
jgi:tetratricopeptide (TPR) repeat protein